MKHIKSCAQALNRWILAQKQATHGSESRLSGMVATLLMMVFGMATAFGITPGTSTRQVPVLPVIEDITQHQLTPAATPGVYTQQDTVHSGDTLAALLFRMGVDDQAALAFMRKDPLARNIFAQLSPGKPIRVQHLANGDLVSLRFPRGEDKTLVVTRVNNQFQSAEEHVGSLHRVIQASGRIQSSLFAAADNAGIPDSVTRQLSRLFSTDIDFHNDLRAGDTFSVIYEAAQDDFDQVKAGRILAAEFVNKGVTLRRVFFDGPDGGDYYTPDGRGTRASFLRSPIEFSRVTSGFTTARFHPILHTWRAHKGIDLAAPMGTPVVAVANATVLFAGWRNGYGNVIELRHSNNISTVYGHLSAFAHGLRKGEHIRQGEVIGYVGMTGWATGPHLHYEFKIAGVQVDPQGPSVPRHATASLTGHNRTQFLAATAPLVKELDDIRGNTLAKFE
ncbi:MAG: M23 family metallopeptidase [Betaproteobacteria bacterium]|nr:M23 family metallopeptidase [Betaproteobacteria bacterium]MDE2622837.1 M23 family metallopeptidase [Betaproteobacteria bacterium]